MFIARGMPVRLLVGGIATALIAATCVSFPTAPAAEGIDEIITGALDKAPVPTSAQPLPAPVPAAASDAFAAALQLVSEGKYADAYDAARGLDNPIERRTVQWAAIYYGNGAIAYDAVQRFEADAADFVSTGVFKTRLEQALIKGGAADDTLISALSGAMPNTLDAQIALAKAYLNTGKKDRAAGIARDIWINDVLDARTEQSVLDSLGALLTSKDHWARAERLMMDVHVKGRAVVSTGTREKMETDTEALQGYGLWATFQKDS